MILFYLKPHPLRDEAWSAIGRRKRKEPLKEVEIEIREPDALPTQPAPRLKFPEFVPRPADFSGEIPKLKQDILLILADTDKARLLDEDETLLLMLL